MPARPAAAAPGGRRIDVRAIRLPAGYRIEPVVTNLSVPTTIVVDGEDLVIAESGWMDTAEPRVLRVAADGRVQVLAGEGLRGPVTGLLVLDGTLYVSHRGRVSVVEGGRIVRDVVTDLPSDGDHQNNQIVAGPDGAIYMGQGTVTNAAVVGVDNYIFGWLHRHPRLHEVPCRDVTLVGESFETENPLTPEEDDRATTGAYKPFGTPGRPGEVIRGHPRCGGSIVRFRPDGSRFELVAWGLRNPFGLAFDDDGRLWATSHGADVRGSRSIFNDPDSLVRVREGAWYGWPEYFAGRPVTERRFAAPAKAPPRFLWRGHPALTPPDVTFDTHSGVNGFAFSPGGAFGFEGDAFIAMFGAYVPAATGVNIRPAGYSVVQVNVRTRQVREFASNALPGPS
ncbi:MAG TPA: PQQ-dependent sugar dehydrogenase [bacterium]|nr:PQQ-dependent sugar dehydrogenase [bacterium]